jgi:predicted ribosome quality control (RQC) complex YloA/Tae2 family protein
MEIKINIKKSLNDNASECYDKSKAIKKKIERLEKEIEKTKELLKKEDEKPKISKKTRVKREKEWYEKFHWFFTSDNKLVIAGKDAKQNDILYSQYLEDNDLFFHADIQGAPATILKNGLNASEEEKKETAQFAASYSSAWKTGYSSIDVYALKKEQVGKHAQGGFVGKGGFTLTGEREWFRNTALGLTIFIEEDKNKIEIVKVKPGEDKKAGKKRVFIKPGSKEKGESAKLITKNLGAEIDEILQVLPQGKISII